MFSGINSFTLMALPLFMLAAEIMVRTGISSKLFDFVRITRVVKWRGGLAYVNVLASTIFGSLQRSTAVAVASSGTTEAVVTSPVVSRSSLSASSINRSARPQSICGTASS